MFILEELKLSIYIKPPDKNPEGLPKVFVGTSKMLKLLTVFPQSLHQLLH